MKSPAAFCLLLLWLLLLWMAWIPAAATAAEAEAPLPPGEAASHMTLPAGFQATLFAGEPDLVQPIAFTIDDRGRIWVVECYSYPDWKPGPEGKDRVLIFEDTDGDGRFDKRRVFWDRGSNLSGLELGFGGVWLCSTPNLLFLPDRDGDDRPDGPPEVVLDGWDLGAKHNVFNGLSWGPDGWLYGLNGILSSSLVGPPGAARSERTPLDCGVWRYHPTRRHFEVVAWGTTNPWGLDFDDQGELFMTNCVIQHLWHVIPGAHFKRMFGQDLNAHVYELMEGCANHLHWAGGPWQESRGGQGRHGDAGGGHAHAGAMVYLGDNWPNRYHNALFTCNLHGNRVNQDVLVRNGSGYTARHAPDFLLANDPWFRGLNLKYGPDGGVYLSDWTDSGECHDYDHVHRESGRLYKITYGKVSSPPLDLARLSDNELVKLQSHPNDWFVRHARRLLAERAAAGRDLASSHEALQVLLRGSQDAPRKLRALWALHAAGGLSEELLLSSLEDPADAVRAWCVRLLCEGKDPPANVLERLLALAENEPSALVRLHLASSLQRIPLERRGPLAGALAARVVDAADPNLGLMLWYGLEPLVAADPAAGKELLEKTRIPLLCRYLAKRMALLAGPASEGPAPALELLVQWLGKGEDPEKLFEALGGMLQSLKGRAGVAMPPSWPAVEQKLAAGPFPPVRERSHFLAAIFGSPEALASLRKAIMDLIEERDREAALETLVHRKDPALPPLLRQLLVERGLRRPALRALAAFDDPATPPAIVERYPSLSEAEKEDAVSTLASRPSFAVALLRAMEEGRIPARDVSAFTARQLLSLGDKTIEDKLRRVWGEVRPAEPDKVRLMAREKSRLTPERLKGADHARGRQLFERTCASCHTLHGSGSRVGPDLTGSQRANLDYLLENLLDPSAVVARDYLMTFLTTRDGRFLSGIIQEENEHTLTLRTVNEEVILSKDDIKDRRQSSLSLMPEGILSKLDDDEARDLIAYLSAPADLPPPVRKGPETKAPEGKGPGAKAPQAKAPEAKAGAGGREARRTPRSR